MSPDAGGASFGVVAKAGEFFYVPRGHDSWVVGDEPYVSLHIMGGENYAA